MATYTILCEPQEPQLIQQRLLANLRQAGEQYIDCLQFSSMGGGHLSINHVASGIDADHVYAVFRGIDVFLSKIGFTRTDEGDNCFLYKR